LRNPQDLAAIRLELAPTHRLRVGLMAGPIRSPFLVTIDERSGRAVGVAVTLGGAIACSIGLPVEYVVHHRLADLDASDRRGGFDLTFVPVAPAREAVSAARVD
jgi:hypothetical protein